ncbi:response regulator [Deltaproteobacteria bacterium TL4]
MALSRKIPLFREIFKTDPTQFEGVIEHCKLLRTDPEETIISKGEISYWLYIVLQGECCVYTEEAQKIPVNRINPGSMFGELAVILKLPRTAFVKAHDQNSTTLIGIDAAIFGSEAKESEISLPIKILFYKGLRRVVFRRVQQLQQQILEYLPHLENTFPKPKVFKGSAKKMTELIFYEKDCENLGKAVDEATQKLGDLIKEHEENQSLVDSLLEKHFKIKEEKLKKESLSLASKMTRQESQIYKLNEITFLIVDANEDSRSRTVNQLFELGVSIIEEEEDGMNAWRFLCEKPQAINVILCEWNIKRIAGLELMGKVLFTPKRFHHPIFMMTTYENSIEKARESIEKDIHGYLLKPLDSNKLFSQLQRAYKYFKNGTLT